MSHIACIAVTITALRNPNYDYCRHLSHIKKNVGKRVWKYTESDCCGTVGVYICCNVCKKRHDKREANELVVCNDCDCEMPRSDTHEYRWYGFNHYEGDEPLVVCTSCMTKPAHLKRIAQDRKERAYDEQDC